MIHYYKLDENKNAIPCSMDDYCNFIVGRNVEIKHIGDDIINDKRISTVFLMIDHNWLGNGAPLLFETMVFDNIYSYHDIYCDRYSTWREAENGHAKAIEWVKNGCKDE